MTDVNRQIAKKKIRLTSCSQLTDSCTMWKTDQGLIDFCLVMHQLLSSSTFAHIEIAIHHR